MLDALEAFFQRILDGLKSFAQFCEHLLARFLRGCLEFIEAVRDWLEKTVKAIVEYLSELLPALGRVLYTLFLLSLFYIPSMILIPWGFSSGNEILWIAGIIYALCITAIGLGFRKKKIANQALDSSAD